MSWQRLPHPNCGQLGFVVFSGDGRAFERELSAGRTA
jgi:hypothetical protein